MFRRISWVLATAVTAVNLLAGLGITSASAATVAQSRSATPATHLASAPTVSQSSEIPEASGGGCGAWASTGGVSVEGCISASGLSVLSDAWERGQASNCVVDVALWDASGGLVQDGGNQPCHSGGHYIAFQGVLFGSMYTEVFLTVNGVTVESTSPILNNP